MASMKLTEQIENLLAEKKIDSESAIRLMLVTQKELLERMLSIEEVANGHSKYIQMYPSLFWFWIHKRKQTILVVCGVFLLLSFILTPITISDIRHMIMDWVGIPRP